MTLLTESHAKGAIEVRGDTSRLAATLVLEDGTRFEGEAFGQAESVAGEVVFNTGMVGYLESLTDPSYCGQILVCTYPLIGNYGVPTARDEGGMARGMESWKIHARGLIVSDYSRRYSHWDAGRSLDDWLKSEKIPAMTGVDTRTLTKRLREKGSMLGRIIVGGRDVATYDPNKENLGPKVSVAKPIVYRPAALTVTFTSFGRSLGRWASAVGR